MKEVFEPEPMKIEVFRDERGLVSVNQIHDDLDVSNISAPAADQHINLKTLT